MKIQLEKAYPMPASADTAWALLQDIEGVAGCMPGARITERIDAQHYKGTVAVKFGPASMAFRGEVEVMSIEPETRTLRLVGKGTDSTGSSGAAMDLTARVEAGDAASCNLVGTSEVSISGKAAAFGGRMMSSVADQVLGQFAANFAAQARALEATAVATAAAAAATATSAAASSAMSAAAPGSTGPTPSAAMPVAPAPAQASSSVQSPVLPSARPAPQTKPLNGLTLAWAVFKDWLHSLFATRRT